MQKKKLRLDWSSGYIYDYETLDPKILDLINCSRAGHPRHRKAFRSPCPCWNCLRSLEARQGNRNERTCAPKRSCHAPASMPCTGIEGLEAHTGGVDGAVGATGHVGMGGGVWTVWTAWVIVGFRLASPRLKLASNLACVSSACCIVISFTTLRTCLP